MASGCLLHSATCWEPAGVSARHSCLQGTSIMVHSKLKEAVMYGDLLGSCASTRYVDDLCSLRVTLAAVGTWLGVAIVKRRAGLL